MNIPHHLEGIFEQKLRLGVVSAVAATTVRANLQYAGASSGSLYHGARYGLGEVGEFVLIEGELAAVLGRIVEVRLPERERRAVDVETGDGVSVHAIAIVQILGSVDLETLAVKAGASLYPRLGDRVYSAPANFLQTIPLRMESGSRRPSVTLRIGSINHTNSSTVEVTPEKLFGRHCAILGTTGGGKSYTLSRLIEECLKYSSKLLLIDATGEFRGFNEHTTHVHLGNPIDEPSISTKCSLPPSCFVESDFLALFDPSGKVQGPKLRAAIRSQRLLALKPQELETKTKPGLLVRARRLKSEILNIERDNNICSLLDNPATPFNPFNLVNQIVEECVYETGGTFNNPDPSRWGDYDGGTLSYCMTLLTRINAVLTSNSMECIFARGELPSITDQLDQFLQSSRRLLRISLEGIEFEYSAREVIANALGRYLLRKARSRAFRNHPIVVLVDEAHHFLGRTLGNSDSPLKLDSFELIAKEGRKYGLSLCLATQRPRDITDGVLSQMGTLVVHRLTNDRDREVVERACGEIDRSAADFLPTLEPGEAAIFGVDFPIPLAIQITEPSIPPNSQGPTFQQHWKKLAGI